MRRIAKWSAVLLVMLLPIGCATQQKTAMENLTDNRHQMDEVRGQIDRTMHSTQNLLSAPPGEIRNAQEEYSTNVKALRKMASDLDEGAKNTREKRIEYLTEWERAQQTVESPQLKHASEQRRREVVANLTDLELALKKAAEGVTPLVSELEDIERVTSNDPTPAGIAAVKKSGIVQTAQKHARTANYRLDVAASRFDRTLNMLSPQPGTRPLPPPQAAPAQPTAPANTDTTQEKK